MARSLDMLIHTLRENPSLDDEAQELVEKIASRVTRIADEVALMRSRSEIDSVPATVLLDMFDELI